MLIAIVLLPLLTGLLAAVMRKAGRRRLLPPLLALQTVEVALTGYAIAAPGEYTTNIWYLTESLTIGMRLDGVASVFALLTVAGWLLTLLYSVEYMKPEHHESRFYAFLFLSESALLATAMSADFVSMYIFYELTSLLSMPLVLHELKRESITGAVKYLYYSIGGAFFVLFGIAVFYTNTYTLDFAVGGTLIPGRHTSLVLLAVFFVIIGFGTKAGMFPMHNWLPSAHPVAPAPASALLSGIITKAGVIGIIRVVYFIAGPDTLRGTWVQSACLCLALLTVFMGSMMAYGEPDFKKRLAYSSISQISYVLTGLFILTPDGLAGSLMQVFFHAGAKIGLFLVAGAVIYLSGAHYVDEMVGLGRQMPGTFLALALLSLSLVGIPPFGGFWSKWYLALAALDGLNGALAYVAPAVLLVSALLTAGYLFTPVVRGFFPGRDTLLYLDRRIREPAAMLLPMVILAAVCLLLGFFPDAVTRVMHAIAGAAMGGGGAL
jgi:multicomponent Na+:H+ antiporter subunit D